MVRLEGTRLMVGRFFSSDFNSCMVRLEAQKINHFQQVRTNFNSCMVRLEVTNGLKSQIAM